MEGYSLYSEIFFILLLILANGCFSMTEIAIISSRSSKLKTLAKKGSAGAKIVLEINEDPSDFLSAIQIGITLIGVFTGAFSGITFARYISPMLTEFGFTAKTSATISLFFVVTAVTYLSLVIGELVPKKIAINSPENIAIFAARPILIFLLIFRPFIKLLSFSSNFIFNLFDIKKTDSAQITEEELLLTLDDSVKSGVVEESEIDIMKNILETNDMRVGSIMVPRNMVVWLNTNNPIEKNLEIIESTKFECYPLADDDLDELKGFIFTSDLITFLRKDMPVDFYEIRKQPFSIPENTSALKALLLFNDANCKMAMVIDEFGGIAGIIEAQDIIRCLTGDLEKLNRGARAPQIVKRNDNSWLIDGMLHISDFKDFLQIEKLPGEDKYRYDTLAGFVIAMLGHIPEAGEQLLWNGYNMEIVDMDGKRIDMVMLTKDKQ